LRKWLGSLSEHVFTYTVQHAPDAPEAAIRQHANHCSTKGYAAIKQQYLENLNTLPGGSDFIVNSPAAQVWGARKEPDGRVTVQTKSMGRVYWKTAMRSPSLGFKPSLR
jgi:hypothetical protein